MFLFIANHHHARSIWTSSLSVLSASSQRNTSKARNSLLVVRNVSRFYHNAPKETFLHSTWRTHHFLPTLRSYDREQILPSAFEREAQRRGPRRVSSKGRSRPLAREAFCKWPEGLKRFVLYVLVNLSTNTELGRNYQHSNLFTFLDIFKSFLC